jgi:hypothetical protein
MGNCLMGNGDWAFGIKQVEESNARSNRILSIPHALLCPLPHARIPIVWLFVDDTKSASHLS